MHPLPFLTPHCSPPVTHSVPAVTLLIITLPYNLPLSSCYNYICHPSLCTWGTIQAPRQSKRYTPISKLPSNLSLDIPLDNHPALEPYQISFHSLPPLLPLMIKKKEKKKEKMFIQMKNICYYNVYIQKLKLSIKYFNLNITVISCRKGEYVHKANF